MLQRIKKSLNDYSLFSSGVRLFNFNQVALQFTTPVFNCFQISFTSTLKFNIRKFLYLFKLLVKAFSKQGRIQRRDPGVP